MKGMEGGEVNSTFPCVNPVIWELSLSFNGSQVAEFSASEVFVDD